MVIFMIVLTLIVSTAALAMGIVAERRRLTRRWVSGKYMTAFIALCGVVLVLGTVTLIIIGAIM